MKRLALLTIIASPAFANQTKFSDQRFLDLTKGDPITAQELSRYCGSGPKVESCIESLKGNGNLGQEAARKCYEEKISSELKLKIKPNNNAPAGSRNNQLGGVEWHKNYVKDPDNGEMHRHDYSEQRRGMAYRDKLTASLANAASRVNSVTGSSTVTNSVGSEAAWQRSLGELLSVTGSVSVSTIKTLSETSKISVADIEEAIRDAKAAYDDPSMVGYTPDILCYLHNRDCTTTSGGKVTNDSYQPVGKDKDGNPEKKDDKKGAENPPKHEDEHTSDIPDVISSDDGNLWAGNDINTPDTIIATPVMDESLAPKSAMEMCVEKETKRLNDEFGKKTIDPNSTNETDKQKQANDLLKHGYCDAEVLGRDFCRAHKFQQDSVVAVDIQEDRKAAAKAALGKLLTKGQCDSHALGTEFCKKNAEKWLKTPAGQDPADEGGKKTLAPGGRSGEAPRINP